MKTLWLSVISTCTMLVACGPSSTPHFKPSSCDPRQCSGAYLVHFVERSGNCGQVPDTLIVIGNEPTSECRATYSSVEDNGCKLVDSIECATSTGDRVLSIQDSTCSSIKGTMSITVTGNCMGTYDLTYTRQ